MAVTREADLASLKKQISARKAVKNTKGDASHSVSFVVPEKNNDGRLDDLIPIGKTMSGGQIFKQDGRSLPKYAAMVFWNSVIGNLMLELLRSQWYQELKHGNVFGKNGCFETLHTVCQNTLWGAADTFLTGRSSQYRWPYRNVQQTLFAIEGISIT